MARPKVTDRAIADETLTIRITSPERQALEQLVVRRTAELEGTGAVITAAGLVRALIVREAKMVLGGIPAQTAPTDDEIRAMVLATIKAIDADHPELRHLVTVPMVKDALPNLSALTINNMLSRLEEAREIDLKIANDPAAVDRPEQGYRIADRGLVYFAILPAPAPNPPAVVQDDPRQLSISALIPSPQTTDSAAKPARRAKPTAPKATMVERLQMVKDQKLMPFAQIATKIGVDPTSLRNWILGTRPIPAKYETQLDAILSQLGV